MKRSLFLVSCIYYSTANNEFVLNAKWVWASDENRAKEYLRKKMGEPMRWQAIAVSFTQFAAAKLKGPPGTCYRPSIRK